MTRLQRLTDATELLDRLTTPGADPRQPATPLLDVIIARMDDAQRGHPGSSMGGGGGHSNGSPVEAMLEQADIGGDALRELDAALGQLERAARTLDRLGIGWAPRQPTAKALRETANVEPSRHCSHCTRWRAPHDLQDVDRGGLCRFCYEWSLKHLVGGERQLPDEAAVRLNSRRRERMQPSRRFYAGAS